VAYTLVFVTLQMGEPAPVLLQTVSGLTVAGGVGKVNLAVLLEGD